mmetsp:Transcript_17929/g.20326  ORF Transcript_17929/g.20326 Transcript_17929/m.20326 type:complete len:88 (+) Transcript_17929:145-408(+)
MPENRAVVQRRIDSNSNSNSGGRTGTVRYGIYSSIRSEFRIKLNKIEWGSTRNKGHQSTVGMVKEIDGRSKQKIPHTQKHTHTRTHK